MKRQLEAVVGSLPAPELCGADFSPGSARLSLELPTFWRLDWLAEGWR